MGKLKCYSHAGYGSFVEDDKGPWVSRRELLNIMLEKIDSCGFECEAGSLANNRDWKELLDALRK